MPGPPDLFPAGGGSAGCLLPGDGRRQRHRQGSGPALPAGERLAGPAGSPLHLRQQVVGGGISRPRLLRAWSPGIHPQRGLPGHCPPGGALPAGGVPGAAAGPVRHAPHPGGRLAGRGGPRGPGGGGQPHPPRGPRYLPLLRQVWGRCEGHLRRQPPDRVPGGPTGGHCRGGAVCGCRHPQGAGRL